MHDVLDASMTTAPAWLASGLLVLALALCPSAPALALPSAGTGNIADAVIGLKAAPANPDDEGRVCFEAESPVIDERGRQAISSYAKRLKDDPRLHVILRGFPAGQGSRAYNLARSQERIDAVEHALERLGVASYQIRKRSHDSPDDEPEVAAGDCRQGARSVDVVLSK
jgi:outer membrane protein OmpA-like peptidoglycan-associated protein